MAGIGNYYYVGGVGGFMGADGLNGRDIEIAVWHGDRKALVPNYLTNHYHPMSPSIKRLIPKGPEDENEPREALIIFASELFKECPSYEKVKLECEGLDEVNLCFEENTPKHFYDLLEESKKINLEDKVHMFYSELHEIKI